MHYVFIYDVPFIGLRTSRAREKFWTHTMSISSAHTARVLMSSRPSRRRPNSHLKTATWNPGYLNLPRLPRSLSLLTTSLSRIQWTRSKRRRDALVVGTWRVSHLPCSSNVPRFRRYPRLGPRSNRIWPLKHSSAHLPHAKVKILHLQLLLPPQLPS